MEQYINKVIQGDCLEKLKDLPDESVDAVVSDPPYELGFMGKKWDNSGIAYNVDLWKECLRVLKPGGHLLAFGGTRTYHRMAVAIEDAGFEVRDMLEWIYASGFPKSHNIGKNVEKQKVGGIKNLKIIGSKKGIKVETGTQGFSYNKEYVAGKCMGGKQIQGQIPVYEINNEWEGFGTALKPAHEPIIMARKPLSEKTIVENVLKHGTGAIDIDGCRIPIDMSLKDPAYNPLYRYQNKDKYRQPSDNGQRTGEIIKFTNSLNPPSEQGRFPANIICTDDALNDGVMTKSQGHWSKTKTTGFGEFGGGKSEYLGVGEKDKTFGSKSRYFDIDVWAEKYGLLQFPKASKKDRGVGNTHATVKPVHLMSWLVRLVSKEGDTVLDPFAGSGTTGVACKNLNRNYILIEKEPEYIDIINKRLTQDTNPKE